MFIKVPILNTGDSTSKTVVLQTDSFAKLSDNGNASVNPGPVATPSTKVVFVDGSNEVILIDPVPLFVRLNVVAGVLDLTGDLS